MKIPLCILGVLRIVQGCVCSSSAVRKGVAGGMPTSGRGDRQKQRKWPLRLPSIRYVRHLCIGVKNLYIGVKESKLYSIAASAAVGNIAVVPGTISGPPFGFWVVDLAGHVGALQADHQKIL